MLLIEWINYHQTELAALTSLISTVFQLMIRHFSLSSLHVCSCQSLLPSFSQSLQSGITLFSSLSCQSLLPSFSQSLQSGVTLFSSLSCQSLLPSCSHSFQTGVSLFSASSSVSLSMLPVMEILLKILVQGTKIFRTKVPVTYPRVYRKIFHFSCSIRSNTIYGMTDVPYIYIYIHHYIYI